MAKQTENNVGIYLRLSQEDLREGESVSIENQRKMLTKFVKEKCWNLVDTYIDDGYTGTDFERPDFQRLLDDAKCGKINTIIVKDLSRFGRNYIEVGRFVDYIFPMNNIRFIALNDGIDTVDRNSTALEMMPVINLFNEWHAASTSKKIKAVLETNAKNGRYSCKNAAYGYIKGDDEKNTPVINPETAPIVKRIFKMRSTGVSPKHIATALNDEGILCPTDYHYKKIGKEVPFTMRHFWSGPSVNSILNNRIYLGELALMRRTTVSHKNHKIIYKDQSDWTIIKDNHEPIISYELWDKVREVEASVSQGKISKSTGKVKPLSGLMYCADCGFKMRQHTTRHNKDLNTEYCGYNCTSYRLIGKDACTSHYITRTAIEKLIVDDIRRMAGLVIEDEETARQQFLARKNTESVEQTAINKKKLQSNTLRIAELEHLIQAVFEDKYLGKITETACKVLMDKYETELNTLKAENNAIDEKLKADSQNTDDVEEFIRRLKKYAEIQELTREMALDLIEYITIDKHPKEKGATRDINIYYKFIDKSIENNATNLFE